MGKYQPVSAHIIGRPDDDLLDILMGHGTDPEQAFIAGRERVEGGDGFENGGLGREPTIPSQ